MDMQVADEEVKKRFAALAWWAAVRVVNREFSVGGMKDDAIANLVLTQMKRIADQPTFGIVLPEIESANHNPHFPANRIGAGNLKSNLEKILAIVADNAGDLRAQQIKDRINGVAPVTFVRRRVFSEGPGEPDWKEASDAIVLQTIRAASADGLISLPRSHVDFLQRCIRLYEEEVYEYGTAVMPENKEAKKATFSPPESLGLPKDWAADFKEDKAWVTEEQAVVMIKAMLPDIDRGVTQVGRGSMPPLEEISSPAPPADVVPLPEDPVEILQLVARDKSVLSDEIEKGPGRLARDEAFCKTAKYVKDTLRVPGTKISEMVKKSPNWYFNMMAGSGTVTPDEFQDFAQKALVALEAAAAKRAADEAAGIKPKRRHRRAAENARESGPSGWSRG